MHNNSFTSNSKPWPKGFILALFLIGIFHFYELVILPVQYFNFRTWEALRICVKDSAFKEQEFYSPFPGPFYPNTTLHMQEIGPINRGTRYSIVKDVIWKTDRYGYRKENNDLNQYDVVLVGDSQIAGSGLTQKDMVSEKLEESFGIHAYPFAPADINALLSSERFIKNPPKVVIFSPVEYLVFEIPKIKHYDLNIFQKTLKDHFAWYGPLAIIQNRFAKNMMGHSLTAKIGKMRAQNTVEKMLLAMRGKIIKEEDDTPLKITLEGSRLNESLETPPEKIKELALIIKSYDEECTKLGIRFIFMPVPNKQGLYYKSFYTDKEVFLESLTAELKKMDVEVIDLFQTFTYVVKNKKVPLYHRDDSHWDTMATSIATRMIARHLAGSPWLDKNKTTVALSKTQGK